mmetsp:Transcript_79691/g.234437  ORF Transcript_79691/g.234437 Transcript_79691/m.234437 type:complete len:80 (-) Transcript_79691:40-279(-)
MLMQAEAGMLPGIGCLWDVQLSNGCAGPFAEMEGDRGAATNETQHCKRRCAPNVTSNNNPSRRAPPPLHPLDGLAIKSR